MERILFVDDEPNILAAFKRQLRKHFLVDTALGGEEGLRVVAERGPFAVVVSDQRMPGMDGMRFLSQVRQQNPDCQCIMLTGNMDQETANSAVNDGLIFRFLSKPCPSDLLRKTLDAAIAQRHSIAPESQ